jgi:hypothetical protein
MLFQYCVNIVSLFSNETACATSRSRLKNGLLAKSVFKQLISMDYFNCNTPCRQADRRWHGVCNADAKPHSRNSAPFAIHQEKT